MEWVGLAALSLGATGGLGPNAAKNEIAAAFTAKPGVGMLIGQYLLLLAALPYQIDEAIGSGVRAA